MRDAMKVADEAGRFKKIGFDPINLTLENIRSNIIRNHPYDGDPSCLEIDRIYREETTRI